MSIKLEISKPRTNSTPVNHGMFSCKYLSAGQEGWGVDLLYDGLIGMILLRKDHEYGELVRLIPEAIARVKTTREENFGVWKLFKQINVFSKYLPDQADAAGAVAALKKAGTYLLSVKPDKFDQVKFENCFAGSCCIKRGRFSDDEVKGTGFWNLWHEDVRIRGWTSRKAFLDGLKGAQDLLPFMKKMADTAAKYKGTTFDTPIAKGYFKAIDVTTKLMGYYGRGITSASKKIGGSLWDRLFAIEN